MRPFVVCIHDASPAYARETAALLRDLAPLIGHRVSVGVVPDWHGAWPLAAHPDYCRLIQHSSHELLLHGYSHTRRCGRGPVTWLAEGSDEMNGLDREDTVLALQGAQRVFAEAFGEPARGFIAPAWQTGYVRRLTRHDCGLEHVMGFFSLTSHVGRTVPLATSTWDCGRWGWLGHGGHVIGRLLRLRHGRVPVLAIHPRDLRRGFWPKILRLTRQLIDAGHEPSTLTSLLGAT